MGAGGEVKLTLKEYLTALRDDFFPEATLINRGYPPKLVWSRAERSASKGYSSYGVSPAHSWITEKGKAMLKELEEQA